MKRLLKLFTIHLFNSTLTIVMLYGVTAFKYVQQLQKLKIRAARIKAIISYDV